STGRLRGFTLLELMITVALLGVIAALAAPEFGDFIRARQVDARASVIAGAFSQARSEAITRLQDIEICWNDGNNAQTTNGFRIESGEMAVMAGEEELIQIFEYEMHDLHINDDDNDECVEYDSQGRLSGFDGVSMRFSVCRERGKLEDSIGITITRTGRPIASDNKTGSVYDCN
ncbi:MAG: GspH/FimT family pseudopilin, partial [Pseudomonadota bacterium]